MSASDDLPVLSALREHTRPVHDRLERLTLGDRITDGSLQPEGYRKLIDWQRSVHQRIEPAVTDFTGGDHYRYRRRFPALVTSSEALVTPPLPIALGTLYVLEGASLGGTVILKNLQQNPALTEFAPFPFYRDQASWGLHQWRAFVAYLKTVELSKEELVKCVRAAVDTFEIFERTWQ